MHVVSVHLPHPTSLNDLAHTDARALCPYTQVGPCFLPRLPGVTVGPYWVLEYNEEEGYALVSGGQPTTRTPDGCVGGSGTYDAGLWIFTRQQQRDPALVEKVRGLAKAQGFDVSVLKDVNQTADCPTPPK